MVRGQKPVRSRRLVAGKGWPWKFFHLKLSIVRRTRSSRFQAVWRSQLYPVKKLVFEAANRIFEWASKLERFNWNLWLPYSRRSSSLDYKAISAGNGWRAGDKTRHSPRMSKKKIIQILIFVSVPLQMRVACRQSSVCKRCLLFSLFSLFSQ